RPLLKSGALLHVGVMKWGEPGLARDDDHAWASVARATGGLGWSAAARDAPLGGARGGEIYEEGGRRGRGPRAPVKGGGIADGALTLPEALDEGEGIEDLRLGDADVGEVTVTGELWAAPVRFSLRPDDGEARLWSALAFGAPEILGALSEPEMMVLAKRG